MGDQTGPERAYQPTGDYETDEKSTSEEVHDASDDAMDRAAALLQYVSSIYLQQRTRDRRARRHGPSTPDDWTTAVPPSE